MRKCQRKQPASALGNARCRYFSSHIYIHRMAQIWMVNGSSLRDALEFLHLLHDGIQLTDNGQRSIV